MRCLYIFLINAVSYFICKYFLQFQELYFCLVYGFLCCGFPCGSDDKESVCNARDTGSILGLGRSPGEENGNPLQCTCIENTMAMELPGVGHNWVTMPSLSLFCAKGFKFNYSPFVYFCFYCHWPRRWVKKDLATTYAKRCSASVFL